MESKKILMVAFHYPPVKGSSGIQRTLKFSNYLRDHGWEPLILTVTPSAYEAVSDDQMAEIPAGMVVERAFALNSARDLSLKGRYLGLMAQPDRWVSWWPDGVWRGLQMIRRHKPAVIFSTCPITTAHMIGHSLARLSGLPWVADCRDSITEPGYPSDPQTWRSNRRLEQKMVHRATKVVFTTEGTREMYADRYPEQPTAKWEVIENGYDEDNFRDAERDFVPRSLGHSGQLTLIHSGILYPQERDPRPFFSALRRMRDAGQVGAESLRIVLRATGSDAAYREMLSEYDISDLVELAPPIAYRDALREMLCADGLLLFQAAMCNHQVPAKLYEYFRAGRPIFSLTDPQGNTAQALRRGDANDIVNIADEHDIESGLTRFLSNLRSRLARGVHPEVASANSRRARSAELAALLDGLGHGS